MKRMVKYRIKPGRVEENERYVAAVYAELARLKPPGLRYATFRLEDGHGFVHIVSHESPDGSSDALTSLPSFKAFVAGVRERCDEPPVNVELHEIGSYGLFER
jgi:hypothetical protein